MDIRQYKQRHAGVPSTELENGNIPSSLVYNSSHVKHPATQKPGSAFNCIPQHVREFSGVRSASAVEGSGKGHEYGSVSGARMSTPEPVIRREGINNNASYSPYPNNINAQVSLVQAPAEEVDPHDVELERIGTYLKNYYGQDEVESQKSLFSVDADDVLALAQCFYLDFFRLLKEKKLVEEEAAAFGFNGVQSTFLTNQPTPQHVGVPIHRDDVMRSSSRQRSVSPVSTGQPAMPIQLAPTYSSSQLTPLQQYQLVQPQPQPCYQLVHPQAQPQYQPVQQQPHRLIASLSPPTNGHPPVCKRHITSRSPVLPKTRVTMKQLMITGAPSQNKHLNPPKPAVKTSPRNACQQVTGERYVAPISLKVAMSKMERGSYVIKYAKNGGKPQKRYMFIMEIPISIGSGKRHRNVPVPHLCWCDSPDSMANPSGRLCLLHLLDVRYGAHEKFPKCSKGLVKGLSDEGYPTIEEKMCFTFEFESRSVDLAAMSESVFQLWVGGMTAVLEKNAELS